MSATLPMTQRRPNRLVCGMLLALVGLGSCGEPGGDLRRVRSGEVEVTGQGVLVIAIDGLRWDHTSLAGYDRDTTPGMRKLARNSVVFENAWGVTPTLVGSHVAILSGGDPSFALPPEVGSAERSQRDVDTGLIDSWFLPPELNLLGRHFLGLGWSTAAFVDHPMIAELRGFDRGFREFVAHRGEPDDEVRAEGALGVGKRFIQWVNERDLDEDWFAYLQMNDLERSWKSHRQKIQLRGADNGLSEWVGRKELAFVPPRGLVESAFHTLPPSRANLARSVTLAEYELRYDHAVRAVDASVARILASVEDFGRSDNLTVVLLGSFGTSMGEHGLYLRAGLAEEADLHVPLLIRPSRALRAELGWGPDGAPPVQRVKELVGSTDLAPTLVDLIGAAPSGPTLGTSLRGLLEGKEVAVRELVPARSSIIPGFALIERGSRASVYHPERAVAPARRTWSGAAAFEDTSGAVETFWARWERLVEAERRALHFGIGVDAGERLQELRAMQGLTPGR